MSHVGRRSIGTRAIFAVAAVCALVFGLLVSGAAQSARGDAALEWSSATGLHLATCHDMSSPASKGATPHQKSDGAGRGGCGCCLAAHAGSAILPERDASPFRLVLASAPAIYVAAPSRPSHPDTADGANGARAPPRRA